MPQQPGEMIDKERCRLEVGHRAAVGVLESGDIVDVEREHRIGSGCLKHLRHVFCRDRIARLRAPVLAGVAKIGDDGGDALGAGILECPDEEKQSAELVIGALPVSA